MKLISFTDDSELIANATDINSIEAKSSEKGSSDLRKFRDDILKICSA
jgi:hypothetical protein